MFFCSYVPALAANRNSSSPLRLPREHKNISYIRNIIYVWENENTRTDSSTKRDHKTQALMGATRPASGIKEKVYALNKGS